MEKEKVNKVYVVGTLQEVDTKISTTQDGKTYMNGKIVVKSIINDSENLTEFKVLAFEKTKTGEDNKVYASYKGLDGMRGKKVRVTGDLREGSMVQNTGNINKFNEIYLKFINTAKPEENECAEFEYSGFVVKSLAERKNKEEEILGYRIEVAQANYNNTKMQVLRFDVDKMDTNIIGAVEANYLTGKTVFFKGTISFKSHTESRTTEVSFGDPVVKTYVVNDKTFRITGGNEPFADDAPNAYTMEEMKKYIEEYKASDAKRLEEAKNGQSDSETESKAPVAASAMQSMTRAKSLI